LAGPDRPGVHPPRRDALDGVARSAREAAGLQAADGLELPLASSAGSDFNDDFHVSLTEEKEHAGAFEYSFRESPVWSPPQDVRGPFDAWAATTGTD